MCAQFREPASRYWPQQLCASALKRADHRHCGEGGNTARISPACRTRDALPPYEAGDVALHWDCLVVSRRALRGHPARRNPIATTYSSLDSLRLAGGFTCRTAAKQRFNRDSISVSDPP